VGNEAMQSTPMMSAFGGIADFLVGLPESPLIAKSGHSQACQSDKTVSRARSYLQAASAAGIAVLGLLQPQDLSDPAGSIMWSYC
jgi:hypothetical protein